MSSLPPFQTLILAAGQGTRMRSRTIKVLHDLLGRPLIGHVVEAALGSGAGRVVTILGHQADAVRDYLRSHPASEQLEVAIQEERRGTADAVWAAASFLADPSFQYTAILSGDVPGMTAHLLQDFFADTLTQGTDLGIVTALLDDAGRYGRILRSPEQGDAVLGIVEYKDATEAQRAIQEINGGVYFIETALLHRALEDIMSRPADNAQNEYYLTDIVSFAVAEGRNVSGFSVPDPGALQGVNTRADLALAIEHLRRRINHGWMLEGVTFLAPDQTFVEVDVTLEEDVTLYPGVYLAGDTSVATGAIIESGVQIRDCTIAAGAHIKAHSYLQESSVGPDSHIGPFAHLRPGTVVGSGCKIGNFVETKKTRLHDGAKASHLTYLGDAEVGPDANVGAGTITCNYDGKKKSQTHIGRGAFIGSNTALVAPVRIGEGAYVGAGSVITEDVPDGALGVARGRQRNIEGWTPADD